MSSRYERDLSLWWMGLVKALPCRLCRRLGNQQKTRTDAHHTREGQGMSQRAGDFLTIAVCHGDCHQGPLGIHGDRTLLRIAKVSELDLLNDTVRGVAEQLRVETRL